MKCAWMGGNADGARSSPCARGSNGGRNLRSADARQGLWEPRRLRGFGTAPLRRAPRCRAQRCADFPHDLAVPDGARRERSGSACEVSLYRLE